MAEISKDEFSEFHKGVMAAKNGEPFCPTSSRQWIDGYQWVTLLQIANSLRHRERG